MKHDKMKSNAKANRETKSKNKMGGTEIIMQCSEKSPTNLFVTN